MLSLMAFSDPIGEFLGHEHPPTLKATVEAVAPREPWVRTLAKLQSASVVVVGTTHDDRVAAVACASVSEEHRRKTTITLADGASWSTVLEAVRKLLQVAPKSSATTTIPESSESGRLVREVLELHEDPALPSDAPLPSLLSYRKMHALWRLHHLSAEMFDDMVQLQFLVLALLLVFRSHELWRGPCAPGKLRLLAVKPTWLPYGPLASDAVLLKLAKSNEEVGLSDFWKRLGLSSSAAAVERVDVHEGRMTRNESRVAEKLREHVRNVLRTTPGMILREQGWKVAEVDQNRLVIDGVFSPSHPRGKDPHFPASLRWLECMVPQHDSVAAETLGKSARATAHAMEAKLVDFERSSTVAPAVPAAGHPLPLRHRARELREALRKAEQFAELAAKQERPASLNEAAIEVVMAQLFGDFLLFSWREVRHGVDLRAISHEDLARW